MVSSRNMSRRQKTLQRVYFEKKAVQLPTNQGEPSMYPAQTKDKSHGEQNNDLMEEVLSIQNMLKALRRVEKNKGAPGIDNLTVESLKPYLRQNWLPIREQLLKGDYKPQPVLQVEIPKPNGGKRLLGIPTIIDRLIQQALLQRLTEIFDPDFSPFSFGFRTNRKAHDVAIKAKQYIEEGYQWVVDLDIEKFFDYINHDLLMARVVRKVKDKRILKLIRLYLQSGVMVNGVKVQTREGTPQGGTLSPLLTNILQELKEEESFNTTDPECTSIKKGKNFYAGFNFQSTVDKKKGLILSTDVVSENNDLNQFANQINKANKILGKKCETACADCGYASTDELEKIDNQEIKVIVPSQRQVTKKEPSLFAKERFTYQDDYYLCPEGHKLTPYRLNKNKNKVYKISDKKTCLSCPHYGICTTSPTGRTISRLLKEEVRQKLEAQYEEPSSQEIYQLKKEKIELPFGHIKHNLKFDSFLLRGLKGAKAEASIIGTCFNLVRMITLLGVPGLIKELTPVKG